MISTGKIFRRWYNFISAKIPAGIVPPPDRIDEEDGVGGCFLSIFLFAYLSRNKAEFFHLFKKLFFINRFDKVSFTTCFKGTRYIVVVA